MDTNKLMDAIGNIDERFISSALNRKPKKKSKRFIAANFLILFVGVCLNMTTLFRCGSAGVQDDNVSPLNVIEHNGAYYEQVDMNDTAFLDKYNLPHEISSDMTGAWLGSGTDPNGIRSWNLYSYDPYSKIKTKDGRSVRSVYINEEDGIYSFVLFCNYTMSDHTEFTELSAVYGIDEWQDIAEITIGDKNYTDEKDIKRLYENFVSSYAMGGDDFDAVITDIVTDEFTHMDILNELAATAENIRMISKDGVVTSQMTYYPTINYIEWALSYFRLNDPAIP